MKTFLCLAVVVLLAPGLALAQPVTGGMFGSITDPSGGAVPQAEIRLLSVTTGARRTVPTNHSGEFVIDGLDAGEYSVTVRASGFKTLERKGIVLSPSERLALGNLSLQVHVAGLGLVLPSTVTQQVGSQLGAVAAPLDNVVYSTLTALGVHVGEADVRVLGIRCGSSAEVG